MQFDSYLTSIIATISDVLYYPMLIGLLIAFIYLIFSFGKFFYEFIRRIKIKKIPTEKFCSVIIKEKNYDSLSTRVKQFINRILVAYNNKAEETVLENILFESQLKIKKDLDGLHYLVRLGPSIGLMGTLIPMGTGLAAMAQGDLTKLSSDLVIAFTTTVVGLGIGIAGFILFKIKNRWLIEDSKQMETITDFLILEGEERGK